MPKRLGPKVRKIVTALAAVAALVLILMWMAGAFREKIEPGEAKAPVRRLAAGQEVGEIHTVTEHVVEAVIGTVVAERKTTVASKILAAIRSIRVSAGSTVKQGDLLVELDDRSLQSQVQQAQEALAGAKASLANAESAFGRVKDLLEKGVAPQSDFDQARANYDVAKAAAAGAEKAIEEAEVALSYARIVAPITGRVVDRLAEPGDTASPGRPLLTLYDPRALRLEAPVREGLATRLSIGDLLTVKIDSLDIEVQGRVDEIVPQAEAMSRSLLVKVGLGQYEGLYTGMFGRLLIPAGERQRICMPQAAVEHSGQLEFVDVVKEGDVLERRFIQTGEHSEHGFVELLSGASTGERVVLHRAAGVGHE